MVFLSLSARLLVNVEALNMVESIGNITRHRRAPIVVREGDSYILRYVPAISGECISHAYQFWLSELAKETNLPICQRCEMGEFVKHAGINLFGNREWEQRLVQRLSQREERRALTPAEIEREIIRNCVVEDVGGFLVAEAIPTKRTSRFYAGYIIPALDQLTSTALEAQFHVRNVPSQPEQAAQMIYYVETGSALYAIQLELDIGNIGYTSMVTRELAVEDRRRHVEIAVKAIAHMMENRLFGAKLTRFNPVTELKSMILTVSHPKSFATSPAHSKKYIVETASRIKTYNEVLSLGATKLENTIDWWYLINGDVVEIPDEKEIPNIKNKAGKTISDIFSEALKKISELEGWH